MKRPSLKKQLILIFLGVAVPIVILLSLLLYFSGVYSRRRLAASAESSLDMFTANLENQLDSVENYLLNLSLNDTVFRGLSEQTDRTQSYLDVCQIAQGFPAVLAANDVLMGVVLCSGASDLYVGSYGAVSGDPLEQLEQKLALEAYLGQLGQIYRLKTQEWTLEKIGERPYLLRSIIYEKASLTAAVDLRSVFEEMIDGYGLDGQIIVLDQDGNRLIGCEGPLTEIDWREEGYGLVRHGSERDLLVQKQVKGLTVQYLVSYQHMAVDMTAYEILLVGGSFFVLMAIPFFLFYMWKEIFVPMGALVSAMERIGKGELSVRSSVDYRNAEFMQVNETFNYMIDQITRLKIDGYEKELEARRNEMTALKLQIRPHFMLNCLKNVYAMVQTGSSEDAQKLILLLSRYLRYILSFSATTTLLRSEIEQCCNYAELSSIGQADPIEIVCEVDEELNELVLPPVSLLTFVENSIKHGKAIGRPLRIHLAAKLLRTETDMIVNLSVTDNGNGFSQGDLRQLNHAGPQEEDGHHVGLHNVVRRLQLLYGEQIEIAFANRRGGGARVELFLPLDLPELTQKKKENEDEIVDRR